KLRKHKLDFILPPRPRILKHIQNRPRVGNLRISENRLGSKLSKAFSHRWRLYWEARALITRPCVAYSSSAADHGLLHRVSGAPIAPARAGLAPTPVQASLTHPE